MPTYIRSCTLNKPRWRLIFIGGLQNTLHSSP
jgi:hypothetical protein